MSESTITFGVNESGHIVYKATNDGVLLSKEEAECVASYIAELESSLDEVAEKWAIAQVNYEECARRNTLLEALVRDMWKGLDCGCRCAMYDKCKHPYNDECLMAERMVALGLLGGDAS